MNRTHLTKFLVVVAFIAATALPCYPENANTQTGQAAETMGDNDQLPFMQTEQGADAQEPSSGRLLFKTLGAMVLIVGLIFFGAWGAKKLGFGGPKTSAAEDGMELTMLSSLSLGNGRTISTVRFGSRVLLVGSTAQAFTLLAEEAEDVPVAMHNSRSVAEMLADEDNSFGNEFEKAQGKLDVWDNTGEQV